MRTTPPVSAATISTTRLAPSPTGALHLGNARTFLINWAMARRRGWRIVLRVEDLDGPRIKAGAIEGAVETLRRLGIDWDAGPIVQSDDLAPYREAMRGLAAAGLVYPSDLTRTQIEASASAPQEGVHELRFPPELRPAAFPGQFTDESTGWRFAAPAGPVEFADEIAGAQRHDPAATVGDFVVWTKRGQPSYQLAVVVDDHRQGVTNIVRGDDLLDSAARQLLLYRALRMTPEPRYAHVPLVRGPDGKRLAKRHGDTRVDTYTAAGVPAERIVGLVAFWSGVGGGRAAMPAAEFLERFDPHKLPREPVTFTPEDHRWLMDGRV